MRPPHPNASDACIHHIEKRRAAEQVTLQRARDLIKQGICVKEGIQLVVVHSQDLSLKGRLEKVGHLLPLRDLRRDAPVVRFLESVSRAYQEPAAPFTPTGWLRLSVASR